MNTFWDWFWLMVWWFAFVMYLILLFQIIADIFRDRKLGGVGKALWVLALFVVPFLSALIYLIVRGRSMGERQAQEITQARAASEEYIRSVAGSGSAPSPTAQLAEAKSLLDSGAITEQEFNQLKAKVLS